MFTPRATKPLHENVATSNGYASPEIARAWREEIERRERDIEEGRDEWLPGEEVMSELRRRYGA